MENEALETTLTDAELDAFDSEWDETPAAEEADEPAETEEPAPAKETEAEAEQPTEEPTAEDQTEEAAEPEAEPEEGHQLFTIKHLGEDKQVSLEELTALAQKGMDYDHVRQERDDLKGKAGKPDDYAELQAKAGYLQEIADLANSSVEELVLRTRARKLMQDDPNLTETDAVLKAKMGFDAKPAEKQSAEPAQETPDDDTQTQLKRFLETYPEVRAEAIPQEVWQDSFAHGGDLTGAYARWENKQLKAQLAQMKQTQQNKTRSTGSRKTAGAAVSKDPFDEGWDS